MFRAARLMKILKDDMYMRTNSSLIVFLYQAALLQICQKF